MGVCGWIYLKLSLPLVLIFTRPLKHLLAQWSHIKTKSVIAYSIMLAGILQTLLFIHSFIK